MEWNDGPSLLAGFVEHKKAPPLRKSGPESITETAFDRRKGHLKKKETRHSSGFAHRDTLRGLLRGRP